MRGLPSEPSAPAAERIRALPYFVHNLVPAIRQSWIAISHRRRVGDCVADDLPRIGPEAALPQSSARTSPPFAVVIDNSGMLMGAIEQSQPGAPAHQAMNPAPQTIRPDMTHRLAASLLRHSPYLLVTTADGRYLGRYAR